MLKKKKKKEAKNPKNMCIHLVHGCKTKRVLDRPKIVKSLSQEKQERERERERERELPDKTKKLNTPDTTKNTNSLQILLHVGILCRLIANNSFFFFFFFFFFLKKNFFFLRNL